MLGMCRGFNFPPIQSNSFKLDTSCILTIKLLVWSLFNLQMNLYIYMQKFKPISHIFQFHQNNSQLSFHISVTLRGTGAFSRDFTANLTPQGRAFTGALKLKNYKLFPSPRGAGDTNDWCIIVSQKPSWEKLN